jgi:hypothetical protein
MFPNVRLLVAAMLASVIAVSCTFAVLAAFRVDPEPLAGIRPARAPLQLLADNSPPNNLTIAWGEPFGTRFRAENGPLAGAAALNSTDPNGGDATNSPAPNSPALWHPAAATSGEGTPLPPNVPSTLRSSEGTAADMRSTIAEPQINPPPPAELPAAVAALPAEAAPETTATIPPPIAHKPATPARRAVRAQARRTRVAVRQIRPAAIQPQGTYFDQPHFYSAPQPLPPAGQSVRQPAR